MDQMNDFISAADDVSYQQALWENTHWQSNIPTWNTIPLTKDAPSWQYAAPAVSHGANSLGHFSTHVPLSPPYTNASSNNSPLTAVFPQDARCPPQSVTHSQDNARKQLYRRVSLQLQPAAPWAEEVVEEDEESDICSSWEPKIAISRPTRPTHQRSVSANEVTSKNAKRAHTVVEKNYRERLNDKINDLAQYLFETSSDSRAKPSKSLVMSRAKERLKQLESRNKALETEVISLKQRVAILDHVVASSHSGENHVYVHKQASMVVDNQASATKEKRARDC